jgi:hypothetical protein
MRDPGLSGSLQAGILGERQTNVIYYEAAEKDSYSPEQGRRVALNRNAKIVLVSRARARTNHEHESR